MTDLLNAQEQDNPTPDTPSAGTEKTEYQKRIDNLVAQKNTALAKLAELEAKQQERESAQLAEQGKYKELYEQALERQKAVDRLEADSKRYQSALETSNQARLERIPEEMRWTIPKYDDPVEMGAWLDIAFEKLGNMPAPKPQAPNLNGGSGGGASARESASTLNPATQSLIDIARQSGYSVDPERVASFAKNPMKQSKTGE